MFPVIKWLMLLMQPGILQKHRLMVQRAAHAADRRFVVYCLLLCMHMAVFAIHR